MSINTHDACRQSRTHGVAINKMVAMSLCEALQKRGVQHMAAKQGECNEPALGNAKQGWCCNRWVLASCKIGVVLQQMGAGIMQDRGGFAKYGSWHHAKQGWFCNRWVLASCKTRGALQHMGAMHCKTRVVLQHIRVWEMHKSELRDAKHGWCCNSQNAGFETYVHHLFDHRASETRRLRVC